ncbi:putative reverse transcriptase domain-containing protein [Tanacetum coccineum]
MCGLDTEYELGKDASINTMANVYHISQSTILKVGMLTDEAIRNGALKKNTEKRGNGIEPSELGFSYEIEIASGQLVEIDKVIRGCKLEIEGHMFDINLIPFRSGSFDVIIGMDWLSNHKAEIICHEKVVRIPLQDGQVLRVIGERPEEKMRHLMSAKAKEQKQEEIVVVRDFPEVFSDDLSGLPPIREIEFRIELIPGAIPVVKSPYRLAPSEMEELSGQLKELQDKDPSNIEAVKNWEAPRTSSEVSFILSLASSPPMDQKICLGLGRVLMQRDNDLYGTKSRYLTNLKQSPSHLNKKELNMFMQSWIELSRTKICEIRYHPVRRIVVADALNRNKMIKPKRIRAMNMDLQSSIKDKILAAQKEAPDESAGL